MRTRGRRGARPLARGTNEIALAGEFFVLGELAARGLVGTLTLSRTKGIDILVLNPQIKTMFSLEVKTTTRPAGHPKLFGPSYTWFVNKKVGEHHARNLVYCFVRLEEEPPGERRLRFFLVPSRDVARYVRWMHRRFIAKRSGKLRREGKNKDTGNFHMPTGEGSPTIPRAWHDGRWKGWEGDWGIFARLPSAGRSRREPANRFR